MGSISIKPGTYWYQLDNSGVYYQEQQLSNLIFDNVDTLWQESFAEQDAALSALISDEYEQILKARQILTNYKQTSFDDGSVIESGVQGFNNYLSTKLGGSYNYSGAVISNVEHYYLASAMTLSGEFGGVTPGIVLSGIGTGLWDLGFASYYSAQWNYLDLFGDDTADTQEQMDKLMTSTVHDVNQFFGPDMAGIQYGLEVAGTPWGHLSDAADYLQAEANDTANEWTMDILELTTLDQLMLE